MPYTKQTAPDWVKDLPDEAKDAWVKAYNAAYRQYDGDEGKAAATASAAIKKMGYRKGGDGKWHKSQEAVVEAAMDALTVFGDGSMPRVKALEVGKDGEGFAVVEIAGRTARVPYVVRNNAYAFGQTVWVRESDIAHDDVRQLLTTALPTCGLRSARGDSLTWLEVVWDDAVSVSVDGVSYRIPYTIDRDRKVVWGKPEKGTIDRITQFRVSEQFDLTVVEDEQHQADWQNGNLPVVIIRAGDNAVKQRRYTSRAVAEADASGYVGLPMHIDHAGREGDKPQPRGLRDWAGKVIQAWHAKTAEGIEEIRGMVHVWDDWLRGRLQDEHFRSTVGLSHVADIAGRREKVSGRLWQVVEAIANPVAVDFVTKAAFGGRVTESELDKRVEDLTMLETVTEADLRDKRPDLVEAIGKAAVVSFRAQEDESEVVKQARADAAAAQERAVGLHKATVTTMAAAEAGKPEHGIPEAARPAFVERVASRVPADTAPDKLAGTVAEVAKSEAVYVKAASGRPTPEVPAGGKPAGQPADKTEMEKQTEQLIG